MRTLALPPGASRAAELTALLAAERERLPFLALRDGEGAQRLVVLEPGDDGLWLGRDPTCEVALTWDARVSRAHAELVRAGGGWAVVDDGLSRNGTFVGEVRVTGRRRLHDGDVLRLGATLVTFRAGRTAGASTAAGPDSVAPPALTHRQREVLVALCRPLQPARGSTGAAAPATNAAIAEELRLSVPAVKTHLRTLGERLGVEGLPQNAKRAHLADLAIRLGLVTPTDYR